VTRIVTFVTTATDPYDRGVELGTAQALRVGATLTAYRRLWEWLDPDFEIASWGGRALASIREQAPRAADEIAGIAAGSGRGVEEIAALNARTEILAGIAPRIASTECSTVVSTAPAGGSMRPPIAVQTWDWYPQMRDNWFVWSLETSGGRRVTTLTEYGVLAKIGVNDAGFGVMLNMLHHTADDQLSLGERARIGFPVHVLLRTLLEDCASVDEARDLVGTLSFSASSAVTVVDRDGDAASMETFPEGVGEVKPEAGLLVRTNHFVSAEGEPGCLAGQLDDNSWVRRDHLIASLGDPVPASAADVRSAMTYHDSAGPVCRHPLDPDGSDYLETATLATATLDVERGELSVLRGGPCGRQTGP
jgi:isopenicillin-N N-acyltransferase-like protein